MPSVSKQLGQLRPVNSVAASIYSPGASTQAVAMQLTICNTTGTAATYQVFQDDDGSTYDADSALWFNINIAANATHVRSVGPMNDATGNVGVQTGTANAINFTLNGTEIT